MDVVGIGHCAVDWLAVVPYYPDLDARMKMSEFHRQGGGEVATALVTLARLGISTSFIGTIGDDEPGNFLISEFQKEGVDVSHVVVEKSVASLQAICIIDKGSGKRTILWHKAADQLRLAAAAQEFIVSAQMLYLDQHEPAAALEAARWCRRAGKTVVLDIDTFHSDLAELVRSVDVLIGSETFARSLGAAGDYRKVTAEIASWGPQVVVITMGERGCLCRFPADTFVQPAFDVETVDTTGCGDVFHGAFVYGLLQRWEPRAIARFASAMAAIKCTKLGGRAGIPALGDVMTFLQTARYKEV